jgi:hypothetical protein
VNIGIWMCENGASKRRLVIKSYEMWQGDYDFDSKHRITRQLQVGNSCCM